MAGRPPRLRVPLERLQRRDPLREWSAEVPAAEVADEPLRVAEVSVRPTSQVGVQVVLDQVSEGVMVVGTVRCTWTGPCSRCLTDVDGTAVAEVGELFETTPTDGESYPLDHEYVDLEPLVRDAVLLELPIGAVQCPHDDPCPNLPEELTFSAGDDDSDDEDPPPPGADPRWAALDQLVFDAADSDDEPVEREP